MPASLRRRWFAACAVSLGTTGAGIGQAAGELRRADALAVVDLQPKIDIAIARGVARLLDLQQRDGSWFAHSDHFAGGQTALCVYTLLKAGLPPAHPGIQRGLAHLTSVRPDKVYVAGAMLMALAETGDGKHRPQMERIVADLLEGQRGSWDYPRKPNETALHGDQDLSITQFALLGLRAAAHAGVKVPAAAWQDALRTVPRYQERARSIGEGKQKTEVAGFRYHLNSAGPSTGSMTTAGLSCLWVARDGVGRLPVELGRQVDDAMRLGRNWLDHNFDTRDNPGFKGQRWLYYLYGVERASAFYQVAYWGGRPWYLDGAQVLIEKQNDDGAWAQPEAESGTCFAILFLKRATAAQTGKRSDGVRVLTSAEDVSDVGFKILGDAFGGPWTFLLTRVAAVDGTRTYVVDMVEYRVGDAAVTTVEGTGRAWTQTSDYASRWQPKVRGKVEITARVQARRSDADGKPVGDAVILESPPIETVVQEAFEPWMLEAATWKARNQIVAEEVEAAASSELDKGRAAAFAVDGREGSAWLCAADDPAPRLVLTFSKPVAARVMILTQANGARGFLSTFDLVRNVRVYVNGSKAAIVADLSAGELTPTRIELVRPTRVRRLEIAIGDHDGGTGTTGAAGFAEVALEK